VPPPPSRAAWSQQPAARVPAQAAPKAPPREEVLETYNAPEPPTNKQQPLVRGPVEDRTIPLTAKDAEPIARALGLPTRGTGQTGAQIAPQPTVIQAPSATSSRPSGGFAQPPPPGWQQGPWPSAPPTALPTYAQPTRQLVDPFGAPEQPTVPLGADPFAAPPPSQQLPTDLRNAQGGGRTGLWVLVGLLIVAAIAAVTFALLPGAPPPQITIVSTPPGADVTIDGRALGQTPVTITEGLEVGHAYELRVTHAGYQEWRAVLQAQNGPMTQSAILAALAASLHVDTAPPGGLVTVGGSPRGAAPVDVTGFLVGQTVEVRASRPGRGVPVVQSVVLENVQNSVIITTPP
jgi:hypothetical protein